MGNGIAHVFAQAGYPVTMIDISQEALDKGRAVAIPGLVNKAGAQAHRLLPRSWLRKVAGSLKL